MLAAGARPKDTKINLMDCICLSSEVEIFSSCLKHLKKRDSTHDHLDAGAKLHQMSYEATQFGTGSICWAHGFP